MRWIWIDKFVEFTPRTSAVALKNVSLAEEHLHDLYPAFPIVPHTLIIEGMAQTAGILVGEARQFSEKVILAKIGKATFHRLVRPGETMLFSAKIEQLNETGASIAGIVTIAPIAGVAQPGSPCDTGGGLPTTGVPGTALHISASPGTPAEARDNLVAEIELMFSHIDKNLSGAQFPEHNFVFTEQFTELLKTYRVQATIGI